MLQVKKKRLRWKRQRTQKGKCDDSGDEDVRASKSKGIVSTRLAASGRRRTSARIARIRRSRRSKTIRLPTAARC